MYKNEFNADALVSIRVNDLVQATEVFYRKPKKFLFISTKGGYYFDNLLSADGPYTSDEMMLRYNLVFKGGIFYEKASVIFSFAGGVKKTKKFDTLGEALTCADELKELSSGTWTSLS